MRKIISLIIVVTMVLVPFSSFAETVSGTEGVLCYTIENDSITITGCFGKDEVVDVPSTIAGYPVNTIAKDAFTENQYVKTVNLPATITTIATGAFAEGIKVNFEGAGGDSDKGNGGNGDEGSGSGDSPGNGDEGSGSGDLPVNGDEGSGSEGTSGAGDVESGSEGTPGDGDEGESGLEETKVIKSVTLSKTVYIYTGKSITPSVSVRDDKGESLTKNTDYKVQYKNNKAVGLATVTVTGIGNCQGVVSKTFKINPKSIKLSSVKAKSKAVTVKWKKPGTKTELAQITGYRIKYSTSSSFKNAKTITVKKNTCTSKTIKKLKAKKYYYFKIQTYKVSKSKTYYSSWSSYKKVKVK